MELLWVCLGGAAGSGARYLVTIGATRLLGEELPWGTLLVNVIGSFFLGILMQATADLDIRSLKLALGTGFMGGFTTYSTYNLETIRYIGNYEWTSVAIYVALTLILCLVAGSIGWGYIGRILRLSLLSS